MGAVMLRAIAALKAVDVQHTPPCARAVLDHDRRHLRRCRIDLCSGETLLVDLPETVALGNDDVLLLEGGGHVEIVAAEEPLYAVRARDARHLAELAWHIGNRHLPAEIADGHILILRDHVIRAMLIGLGAEVMDVVAPFNPVRGAYSGHHGGGHAHEQPPPSPSLHRQYELNHGEARDRAAGSQPFKSLPEDTP